MAYHQRLYLPQNTPLRNSPLRQTSTASTASSVHTNSSEPFPPSRTSTMSSAASNSHQYTSAGHKRGISEAGMDPVVRGSALDHGQELGATGIYKSTRQSLRQLPQPPNDSPQPRYKSTSPIPTRGDGSNDQNYGFETPVYTSKSTPPRHSYSQSLTVSRADSITPSSTTSTRPSMHHLHPSSHVSLLSTPDLTTLKNSSTGHLRTLSKFAQSDTSDNFSITSPAPSVIGLYGRRQLKRTDSTQGSKGTVSRVRDGYSWSGRNWMDQQRQFLQAYEYLCHIGEAKEWIEDVIHKPIPPIVQLEEALRDGVTLAEVVQAFAPDRPLRIFRNPKLQFRHSDNIALFFQFLGEVELPELFRFELIDLYEKKNIPKVIHCIHALSWLLFRNGIVNFRIGNLVGQLEFEHHELEEVQKGLDKSGVSMPSFSFGAEQEPEPEPVESEEVRIDRELSENEAVILDFQSQIRGSLLRERLTKELHEMWDHERILIEFQSRARGKFHREVFQFRLTNRRCAIQVQSFARGYLARIRCNNMKSKKVQDVFVTQLQTLMRARVARERVKSLQNFLRGEGSHLQLLQSFLRGQVVRNQVRSEIGETQSANANIGKLQAVIRGRLERLRVRDQKREAQKAEIDLELLQATARGWMVRERKRRQAEQLFGCRNLITATQAISRGMTVRQNLGRQVEMLQKNTGLWRALQASSRGFLLRAQVGELRQEFESYADQTTMLQAYVRGRFVRQEIGLIKAQMNSSVNITKKVQSLSRGHIVRQQMLAKMMVLDKQRSSITALQATLRGCLVRQRNFDMVNQLLDDELQIIELQALSRAMLLRLDVGGILAELEDEEPAIVELQAAARAMILRRKNVERQQYYNQNMEKVIKAQSFVRGKIQGSSYTSLTSGKNPPVSTVKNFVHLLNDSNFDFDEEIEMERLRKTVVQHVRQNEMADQYITQLDIKIALLVKNKITLDEVVKHQKHFGGSVGNLLTNTEISSKDPFDLKALNKTSRRKLERYQELFFILQTQPQYLARLFKKLREQATAEKECERMKYLIMGLFGYAQKRREEYYLLKVITRAIKEEVDSCHSMQDYLRGNFFWTKVFSAYVKSPPHRKFMRDLLGPLLKDSIIDNYELDLESDPKQIYVSAIENEQLRTGRRSTRPMDISSEEAIRDEETRRIYIDHLRELREITTQFFATLEALLHKVPYGVRYIAQQMSESLKARFQDAEPRYIMSIVGNWVWKSYLQPALLEPEKFGAVDRGLSQDHKRNLGAIAKVINQIAIGRLFSPDNIFLQPLNSYIGDSIHQLEGIWGILITVPKPERQFDIDEFNDLYAKTKPTLYIKMSDIFSIHQLVLADVAHLCPAQDDILRDVLRELGSAKSNESELMGVSTAEICLTLNPKLHDVEDSHAVENALFMETKRCILYIIRVQSGANLMEIMVKPITMEDEDKWEVLVRDELAAGSRKWGAYAEANTILDIASMSYAELKRTALENILQLEQYGRISRHNHYQELLNAIALDIRTKHRRRQQRQNELEGVRLTLVRLNDQAVYLEQQLKTYNDYIEQAMITLQNKKGKKRFLMPFTKQWNHEQELQRSGRVPKFGSFKYSAQELSNRGILVSWQGYNERQWDKIDLTISSNEVGVFVIEGSSGSIAMPGASAQIPLDDLLQAQFNGTQFLDFFGGVLRVNVNLFLHLIMRKFYKDRE
ncbi:MAG: hypothetical protein MMC33_000144 [Icmadophila ericetorum]|nr:hypothetical protein [Icmadophila ericetorum]